MAKENRNIHTEVDLINSLLGLDSLIWDPTNYVFKRDEKDMHPYSIIKRENDYIIIHNIVGINKKDLSIKILYENRKPFISIEGKSVEEITQKEYSVKSRFMIDEDSIDLDQAKSTCKNGLLYITIPFKKINRPVKKIITID